MTLRSDPTAEFAFSAAPGWIILGIGLIVVAVLAGLVWWDSRRGRPRPPRPDEQPAQATGRPAPHDEREPDDFGPEGARMHPHELKGHGNQGIGPPSPDRRKRGRGGRRTRAE